MRLIKLTLAVIFLLLATIFTLATFIGLTAIIGLIEGGDMIWALKEMIFLLAAIIFIIVGFDLLKSGLGVDRIETTELIVMIRNYIKKANDHRTNIPSSDNSKYDKAMEQEIKGGAAKAKK